MNDQQRRTPLVPPGFIAPTELVADDFRLEPLGPQHNDSDLAAWSTSMEHIRATPGYPDGSWPPLEGMTPERNLADLTRHAEDFAAAKGFTFTVLESAPEPGVDPSPDRGLRVIGCVYLYPADTDEHGVSVQSWVRADRADLDVVLADAVEEWLDRDWPWVRSDRHGRPPSGRATPRAMTPAPRD